jgi:chemotaxis protein MotA
MFLLAGLGILAACILVAFTMEGGKPAALLQLGEFIIIGGAGFSSLLAGTSFSRVMAIAKDVVGLIKPDSCGRAAYLEMLQMLYEVSNLARREGLLALEPHVERPEDSDIIRKYGSFACNPHAVDFMCDSLRLVVMGGVGQFELQEMMDGDLEVFAEEAKKNGSLVANVGDAMPGFGIVAAVLGVVITMQAIGGPPEKVGEKVGAALVGTFLGVLLAYGVFGPVSMALHGRAEGKTAYMNTLKCGLSALAQGMSPMLVVEFARRSISSDHRPGFQEVESVVKGRSMAAGTEDQRAA